MALLESLTLSVGTSVARSLFKLWMSDKAIAQSPGLSLSQIAEGGKMSFRERRSAVRSFERVAEEVAAKLTPFIEMEFRGLGSSEIEAATLAVQGTIEAAPLDDSILLATDLDPFKLEAALRAGRPDAAAESHLSTGGVAVYDFTIREVANYITEIVTTLPEFQSRAAREMLARETTLISLTQEVLERLPDSGFGDLGDAERFEAQYRREVARKLDRLELFGVRTSEFNKRYALSVAYIGLTAKTTREISEHAAKENGSSSPHQEEEGKARPSRTELSIEKVLAEGSRHLIRGEAGSGKTTLLQWLAISSARRSFKDSLEEWNDATIPFFIQLRRFVGEGFPQASDFPSTINRSVAEQIPPGWAIQQMEQGRAMVLIDGVDELREDERAEAAEWLQDLVSAYPDARYVVTSRPPAVSEKWLDDLDFSPSFLESMDLPSIDSFIDHWHTAAKDTAADEDEVQELVTLASRLQTTVRENSRIRGLATSPLLCAMLCALNRDWKAQLPQDRVELYRIGLEMLLERRDAVRAVGTEDLNISRQQKEVLLQSIAYWLLINGFSDARTEDIEHLLEDKVESMPRLEAGPDAVLRNLLLRSGLVREPIKGRVDFIHRTFQEYLAGKQMAEERSVGVVIQHAAEDQWQEVVVLAAGLGNEELSQQLIRGLLDRAGKEEEHRHRLQLLAVACLETAPTLPKPLQDEINTVLKGLIPPKSMSEAKAIASAGDVAIPLLAEQFEGPVATVAPSARALGLIGGQAALATLTRFSPDPRVTVARELVRSWDFFPTDEYAERVLRKSPLDRGRITVTTPAQFLAIRHLEKLSHLLCWTQPISQPPEWDWSSMGKVRPLRTLEISWRPDLTSLNWPADGGKSLEDFSVTGCDNLEQVDVSDLESLNRLQLFNNEGLRRVEGVESLKSLQVAAVTGSMRLEAVQFPPGLQVLFLRELPLSDLSPLSNCSQLINLRLGELDNITQLGHLSEMQELGLVAVSNCPNLADLSALSDLRKLQNLELTGLTIDNHAVVEALPSGLTSLTLEECPRLTTLIDNGAMSEVQSITLSYCAELRGLSALSSCPKLEEITMIGCLSLEDIGALAGLEALRRVDLEGCRSLKSIEALYGLPDLEWVDLRGCSRDLDATPLVERGVDVALGRTVSAQLREVVPAHT